jgi:hypothetical protein
VPFTTVLAMDAAGLDAFTTHTLAGVEAMAMHERAALQSLGGVTGKPSANGEAFQVELVDGVEVTGLRAEHDLAMYRAVVARARSRLDGVNRGAEISAQVTLVKRLTAQAGVVVARREPHDRLGATETVAGHNPARYPDAAHYNAHTLTCWTAQEDDLATALAQAWTGRSIEATVHPLGSVDVERVLRFPLPGQSAAGPAPAGGIGAGGRRIGVGGIAHSAECPGAPAGVVAGAGKAGSVVGGIAAAAVADGSVAPNTVAALAAAVAVGVDAPAVGTGRHAEVEAVGVGLIAESTGRARI